MSIATLPVKRQLQVSISSTTTARVGVFDQQEKIGECEVCNNPDCDCQQVTPIWGMSITFSEFQKEQQRLAKARQR